MSVVERVAVVTGGSRGIGRAVAVALAETGFRVAVTSRDEASARDAAAELPGERAMGVRCDVRQPRDCEALIEAVVERWGRLDVLVNNAGIGEFASTLEMSVDTFQRTIETNLCGPFYCARAAAPHLTESGDGWIVNIGSLAGRHTFAGGVAYNASKFGLVGLSEAMMLDLRHEGVRVSTIMPGSVDTAFGTHEGEGQRPWALQPRDVARALLDLLAYPGNAHPSRIELRPSQPERG